MQIEGVRFGYQRDRPVVHDCSAALRPGRVTAMVGPNAAGKTTLLRLMLGLLEPWSGRVTLDDQPIERLSARQRAGRVSYVPQRPGVRFAFTVRQVVAMGAHAHGKRRDDRVEQAINQAGLGDIADRVFAELSGGQQQRAVLARAQLQASRGGVAMLLDEPGSHLDLKHRHDMMARLRELAQAGLAVLIVLHDLDLAARYADDAWLMDAGRLVATGDWQQVLTPEHLCPVYGVALQQIDTGGPRPLLAVASGPGATI